MYNNKSLLNINWKIKKFDERSILYSSQINDISPTLSKLIHIRGIKEEFVKEYLNPDITNNIPNPSLLKDMDKSVKRVVQAIQNKEKIGIIADYDVDGSTSAAILYKFISFFSNEIIIHTPNRLSEGYGPNIRILDQMFDKNVKLIFTLDCGTTSNNIIDDYKYSNIDIIVIDHHLSNTILPKVFSIINPNRMDENNNFKHLAAVGVTFLFLMALRKKLREEKFFDRLKNEPNLLSLLDLVALGTVCDVVSLVTYNRIFVKIGLDLIKKRKNKPISTIIDNSNINYIPTSSDLGFIVGPQLNAASRIDDSSLAYKILISNNNLDIENISSKLILLNEKRKLIEKNVYEDALKQAEEQYNQNFILVFANDWHNGVLGIVASKLINKYHKPAIVISFINSLGVGSARSIENIDISQVILDSKNQQILISGGGHKMAAGLKIYKHNLPKFIDLLNNYFNKIPKEIFQKKEYYDVEINSNDINNFLLESIEKMEPFGKDNPEPTFIIKDLKIENVKIIKDKHLLIFSQNDFASNLKAICFNCINTNLGDYLLNFKKYKLAFGCSIRRDYFSNMHAPQLIIKDAMIID